VKRLLSLLPLILLIGCAGWSWENAPVNNSVGYFAGKGVALAVHEIVEHDTTVPALEAKYDKFLEITINVEIIQPAISMQLYNDLILILGREIDDPYGLIADLTFLMSQFGAEFAVGDNKVMTGIAPIPREIYVSFAMGWDQGKWLYENELKEN